MKVAILAVCEDFSQKWLGNIKSIGSKEHKLVLCARNVTEMGYAKYVLGAGSMLGFGEIGADIVIAVPWDATCSEDFIDSMVAAIDAFPEHVLYFGLNVARSPIVMHYAVHGMSMSVVESAFVRHEPVLITKQAWLMAPPSKSVAAQLGKLKAKGARACCVHFAHFLQDKGGIDG